MKKMTFLAVLAAAAALVACTEKDNPTPGPGNDPGTDPGNKPGTEVKDEVSVSPATVSFEGEGGTYRVAVTTNADDYTVSGAAEWLTVAKNGKELSLTAAANTVNEPRSCTLTVAAGLASVGIAVSQKAGSPYPGYTTLATATMEYSGTMLYQFLKPTEEDYGGTAFLSMDDEDGNHFSIWVYTDLFKTEDEVELTTGTYTKGADNYPYSLAAKKLTFIPGVKFTLSDEDEEESENGSYYTDVATGQSIMLVDGTVEVIAEGEGYIIKVDMKGDNGNDYKYVYLGAVTIDAEGATYPSENERIDVASTIYQALGIYCGDAIGNGTTTLQVQLYSGDPNNPAMTQFTFIHESVEFSEDMDFSGTYSTPEAEEEGEEPDPLAPGAVISGYMQEVFPGFSWPQGTYVMYSMDDILLGDLYNSLILDKHSDGTYSLMGSIMSQDGDFVIFMGLNNLPIQIVNGAQGAGGEDD